MPAGLSATRVVIDGLSEVEAPDGNPNLPCDGEMAAYVMYTSGSTGNPKGVVIPHRAISRLVLNCGYAQFDRNDRVAFASNPAFDASTMEVWAPLLNGGRVVVIDQNCLLDPLIFGELLKWERVSVLWLTAGLFHQYAESLAEVFKGLRYLIVGGDVLEPSAVARVLEYSPPRHLLSGYGPTETTTFAITNEIRQISESATCVPLGRPISNTQIYVLDQNEQPAPIGVSGEIYIAGDGMSRCYLNSAELTAERFLPDPFGRESGARIYKSGDVGRWRSGGEIEFVGRMDRQVKIRGFRVEPGEIEAKLASHPEVREAVVLTDEDDEIGKRLVAYYTGQETGAQGLRAFLATMLPEYMIPAAYVHLETLPLTPLGKFDRKALPALKRDAYITRDYEEPVGEIERRLMRIWGAVLKVERVGRHDNFFDLGGHSLIAMSLVNRCKQMNLAISVTDLFSHPTIKSLATCVSSREGDTSDETAAIPLRTEGNEPPLFLVHELSGEVMYGSWLVPHLAPGFPVYGLAAPGLSEQPLRTIQAMATRLVRIIRGVQPEGPYRIAGWSFGATLAHEIATQLIGDHASVEFLGSLDGYYLGPGTKTQDALPLDDESLLSHITRTGGERSLRLKKGGNETSDYDALMQTGAGRSLMAAASVDEVRPYLNRYRRHAVAARAYIAHPIPVALHLFAAEEANGASAFRNWETVLPETQVRSIAVPGSHQSMMEPPHLQALGEALSRAIRQARETRLPEPQKDYSPMLSISGARRGAPPVLCVPGAGATAITFLDLANSLDYPGPIEAMQARGLEGALVPHSTVPAAAREYLHYIGQKYPYGPVHLVGHSFGGWVAFEMAQQLREAGRTVASLTLLDSNAPDENGSLGREYSRSEAIMELVNLFEQMAHRSLNIDPDQIEALRPQAQLELLSERLAYSGLMPPGSRFANLIGPVRTFETALRTPYHPRNTYSDPVRLVLAHDPRKDTQSNEKSFERTEIGWRRWAPNLTVWHSPGNHMTMLHRPHVSALSEWLLSTLSPDRVLTATRAPSNSR